MMRSESTKALGQPSDTKLTMGARGAFMGNLKSVVEVLGASMVSGEYKP